MSLAEDGDEFYYSTIQLPRATSNDGMMQSVLSSCRICLSQMLSPASLVCGHRFCEGCLNKYWKAMEKPEFLVCPLCREFAAKVGFVKSKSLQSTQDFRKCFEANLIESPPDTNSIVKALALKISLLMSLIFVIVTLVRPFVRTLLLWL